MILNYISVVFIFSTVESSSTPLSQGCTHTSLLADDFNCFLFSYSSLLSLLFFFPSSFHDFFSLQGTHTASDASINKGIFLPMFSSYEVTACLSPQVALSQ